MIKKYYYPHERYSVTYNTNGGSGSVVDPHSPYFKNRLVTVLPYNGTKIGHTFLGWEDDFGTIRQAGSTFNIIINTNFTALWEPNKYTIVWKNWNNSVIETDTNVPYGSSPSYNSATPTKQITGYTCTFTGWSPTVHYVNGDETYVALFTDTPKVYNIMYHDIGVNVPFSGTHETGYPTTHTYGTATTLKTATKTGYIFDGWYTNQFGAGNVITILGATNYTSTIHLYVKWTANTNTPYKVKHYKQNLDGTYPSTPTDTDNLTGTTGASVTPAVKSYEGFTAPSTQTVTILADGSRVVTYNYTRNSYNLTWNLDGGTTTTSGTGIGSGVSVNTTSSIKFGTSLTAPTVTKTGYPFSAWSPSVAATMPAANTTYTATWTENSYEVTFYNGGHGRVMVNGSEIANGNKVFINSITTKTLGAGADAEYYFTGWTTTGGVVLSDATSMYPTITATSSGTVTATWAKYSYIDYWTTDNNPINLWQEGDTSLNASYVRNEKVTDLNEQNHYRYVFIGDPTRIYGFEDKTTLLKIVIPNSIGSISYYAFEGCTGLTSVIMGSRITSIGEKAFYECTSLTYINIPNSVTIIFNYAFADCTSLETIELGTGVTSIRGDAFRLSYTSSNHFTVICHASTPPTLGDSVFAHHSDKELKVPNKTAYLDTAWETEFGSSNISDI